MFWPFLLLFLVQFVFLQLELRQRIIYYLPLWVFQNGISFAVIYLLMQIMLQCCLLVIKAGNWSLLESL